MISHRIIRITNLLKYYKSCVTTSHNFNGTVPNRGVSYASNVLNTFRRSRRSRLIILVSGTFTITTATILGVDYLKSNGIIGSNEPKKKKGITAAIALPIDKLPVIVPSRIVSGPTKLDIKFTLYQYQTCPFCCKLRAFMDYNGIPYDVIEVNPVLRQQIRFSEYRKVPILLAHVNGSDTILQLNDSSVIISLMESYLLSRNPKSRHHHETLESIASWFQNERIIREDGIETDEIVNKYFLMFGDIEERRYKKIENIIAEERQWRRWADDVMVHTLSPNIYRTWNEALQAFNYFSRVGEWEKNFSAPERYLVIYVGAAAMYFVGKRLKKRHNLKDDVRESLYDAGRHWVKFLGNERKFKGGDKPNLADLAVYGVLNSIEGCDSFNDLLTNTKIGEWYYNVKDSVKNHTGHKYFTIYRT